MQLPSDDEPPLGFLLVRIAEAVDAAFVDALERVGLTPRTLRLLVLVARDPGLNQRTLARRLDMDAGNLVKVLEGLEGVGLIDRRRHEDDRRQRLVDLTAEGRRVLDDGLRAAQEVEDVILGAMPASARRSFYERTLRIHRAVTDQL